MISLREPIGGLVEGGELSVRLTLDGLKEIEKKKLTLGEEPMSVTGTLSA
ncbi:MAG: hypothetical protein R6T98_10670 [Desulfatiglandales bacterium]